MRESIVFDYLLANAWGLPLCHVSVSEDGVVQCQENREDTQSLQLEKAEVERIKAIVSEHTQILDYDSKKLESPDVFDGVMNFFDFKAADGRTVHLMAFIAIFKIKASTHKNETSQYSQKEKSSQRPYEWHLAKHLESEP